LVILEDDPIDCSQARNYVFDLSDELHRCLSR
jgi:hypothetical protein